MIIYGILTHGGVGSPVAHRDGCEKAADAGFRILEQGGRAWDAVVEAVRLLEDDGRFNAGSGSSLRLDGRTIEMDAALMDSEGRLGAVAALSQVRNPILVAREVMTTPHVLLCGAGAVEFARRRGLAAECRPSTTAMEKYQKIRRAIAASRFDEMRAEWRRFDLRSNWNFDGVTYEEVFAHGDTVGAVAIDREGGLAAANSTGGASPMLKGRVGDSPLIGCGFFAGPAAAVVTTGVGEEIIKKMLAHTVYEQIRFGEEVQRAGEQGLASFPQDVPVGLLTISRRGYSIAADREMASASCLRSVE